MKNIIEDATLRFLVGVGLLVAGLWMFLQKVYVASNFFNFGIMVGPFRIYSGILVLPLIACLVWLFIKPESKLAKWFSIACGVAIIIYAVTSVNIRVGHIPLLKWIVILLLIALGAMFTVSAQLERKKDKK